MGLNILSDELLGFLWYLRQKCNGLGKKCEIEFNFSDESKRFLPSLIDSFNKDLVPKFGVLEFRLSPYTLVKIDALISGQENKLSSCMDGAITSRGGYSGIKYLREKIQELKKLRKKIAIRIKEGRLNVLSDVNDELYKLIYKLDDRGSCLLQIMAISEEGFISLDNFLNNYVAQYATRELDGQELLELPNNYSILLESYIKSQMGKFGAIKIPVNLARIFKYPVHSLLYLDYLGRIKIQVIRRQEDAPTSGLGTKYKSLYWEWQAIVDSAHKLEKSRFVFAGIELDCSKATLTVRNSVPINPENQEILLLKEMMAGDGVVQYVDLARAMGMNAVMSDSNNSDLSRVVQDRMKILKSLLVRAGMTEDEVRDRIVVKNKIGYQLRNVDLKS